jgi:hypothetical protein
MKSLVKNLEKMQRPIIFDGLKSGFQLTDIDFTWEYKNKFLILGEIKEFGKDITIGQQITTTRIINSWNNSPEKIGIIIFAQHQPDIDKILLADCIVKKIYDGQWRELKKEISVKQFIDLFLKKHNIQF